jgi:aminopeptidase N
MAVAEITKSESVQRAGLLRVRSCDVVLDLTRGDGEFGSESVIRFDCAEPGAASYADLVARTVHEIRLNGVPLNPGQACADGRIALPDLAASNELRVRADFGYTGDGSALHRSTDSADGRSYCFTQLFPADARRVFACFDQPDLKAEFGITVTAPAGWVVLSNMPTPAAEPAGDGTAVWRFEATPRISTYLVAVVAGEYHLVTGSHTTPAGQVIPLGVACRQSLAEHLEADDMLGITRQGLDYYTQLFGSAFPFPKYDQVIVPEFQAGAMENVGCVTFSEGYIYRSKATQSRYEIRAVTILHEMAHQWFGDLVTMRWWEDLWLNESFAEFCGTQAAAEATTFTGAWTTFCAGRKVWGYLQDQQPSTHPIAGAVPTLTEAISNFDGISYAKGGSVLKQLVAYLGREQFFAGIRAYFAANAFGNASLSDLLAALEASSGKDLAGWSKAWLESAGPNTLRPDFQLAADGTFTEFAVLQEASAEHPTLRPHHFAVGLYQRDEEGKLVRAHRVELDATGKRTVVPELAGLPRSDLILLNDDDLDFVIGRFDDRSLATMMTSIGDVTDSLARTVCWSAALDMAIQGELSVPGLVAIIAAGMRAETSVQVVQTVLNLAQRLIDTGADPTEVPGLRAALAGPALTLLRGAEPGSDWQLAWAQLLSRTAVTPEQLDLLAGLLDGSARFDGLPVGQELRWPVLRRLAVTGRVGDEQIDAELALDSTDAGRNEARGCRAAIGDAAHKAEAWRLLAESDELGTDGIVEVAAGFGQPEHAALLAPYAAKYFEQLPAIWSTRPGMLRIVLGRLLFPYTAASPELLQRTDEFLAAGDLDPGLARAVIEGRDVAAKALRARALDNDKQQGENGKQQGEEAGAGR